MTTVFDPNYLDETTEPGSLVELWRRVVAQAMEDATRELKEHHQLNQRLIVEDAKRWLLQPNKDFEEVCALAELEADYVRKCARQMIDRATALHDRQAADAVAQMPFVTAPGVGQNFAEPARDRRGSISQGCAKSDFFAREGQTP